MSLVVFLDQLVNTYASYRKPSCAKTSGDTKDLLIFVHMASIAIGLPLESGARLEG